MFSKMGKIFSKALTPKHGLRATRKKYLPKIAGGAALIGSGILADKAINALEGPDESFIEYGTDPLSLVDRSWSIVKLEDVHNGARSGAAFGPASITTWIVIALFAFALLYPS